MNDGAWWRTRVDEILRGEAAAAAAATAAAGAEGAAAAVAGAGGGDVIMVKAPVATILNVVTVPFKVGPSEGLWVGGGGLAVVRWSG
jgi:hypothetical protein